MENPGFQDYFLPLLEFLIDGKIKKRQEIYEKMALIKNLTNDLKSEMLPNQSQPTYINRIGWALTYLKKAGLLSTPNRSYWQITHTGIEVAKNPPVPFKIKYLRKFNSFNDFQKSTTISNKEIIDQDKEESAPYETLITNFEFLKKNECSDLLEKILEQTPEFFEKLVIDLLLKMGYGGSIVDVKKQLKLSQHTGKSGDEGIDGIINGDRLGLDKIYIQAKRWKIDSVVGRPEIQRFAGALSSQNARKGVFITTTRFTKEAISFDPKNGVSLILIDGDKLVELMYEYNVGVNEIETLVIKKIDSDYFES